MRGCCLTNLIVLGVTDPPEPGEDMYFYYATVTMSGGFIDELAAGSLGTQGIGQFDGAGLATFLQSLAVENAGAGMNSGDTDYGFWIVIPSSTAPADWTWNDVGIVFTDGGIVTQVCYEAELLFVDITDWSLLSLSSTIGNTTVQGAVPLYTDPGWEPFWQTFAVQIFGTGITATSTLDVNTITLRVFETYLPEIVPLQAQSVSPVPSTQTDDFDPIACP